MKGKVYLVGAGPGDPEILTVRALRLLKTADVVLHDDLVPKEILDLVSPAAQVYDVGKRCGAKKITQEEINFLMVSLAGAGLTVVRLKSGDPLIFGRGGEEIEALHQAGVQCEIVPGVTAALGAAASAQIPLTHRRISHAVVFLTGHMAAGNTDWGSFVSSGATLVIYMPGRDWQQLASQLISSGLSPETPSALISAATSSNQRIAVSTLRELSKIRSLAAPSLLIVGEVVRLAQEQNELATPLPGLEAILFEARLLAANEEIL